MADDANLPALILGDLGTPSDETRRFLMRLPDPTGWRGQPWLPWGRSVSNGRRHFSIVQAGRKGFYYAGGLGTYDTLRDGFVAERLNGRGDACGCIIYDRGRNSAVVNCEAQLEQMRQTMRRILIEAPTLDLPALTHDLFAGQDVWREHYLWWLEHEELVSHVGVEDQSTLTLTQEGASVLIMLEMTKPGSNIDMSPEAALAQEGDQRDRIAALEREPVPNDRFLRGGSWAPR